MTRAYRSSSSLYSVGRFVVRSPHCRRVGLGLFRRASGIDERRDHHRQLAAVDQVVEHVRRPGRAGHVDEGLAVLEDHQVGFDGRIVLSRHVDPIGVLRAGIGLAVREDERAAQHAPGHALALERIRTERVERVHVASRRRRRRGSGLWRRRLLGKHERRTAEGTQGQRGRPDQERLGHGSIVSKVPEGSTN